VTYGAGGSSRGTTVRVTRRMAQETSLLPMAHLTCVGHTRAELEEIAGSAVAQCRESGERVSLDPMSPFERKVVHDAVAAAGLVSESEGVEPRRFVVILPE